MPNDSGFGFSPGANRERMVFDMSNGRAVVHRLEANSGGLPAKVEAALSSTYIAVNRRRSDCFDMRQSRMDESDRASSPIAETNETVSM